MHERSSALFEESDTSTTVNSDTNTKQNFLATMWWVDSSKPSCSSIHSILIAVKEIKRKTIPFLAYQSFVCAMSQVSNCDGNHANITKFSMRLRNWKAVGVLGSMKSNNTFKKKKFLNLSFTQTFSESRSMTVFLAVNWSTCAWLRSVPLLCAHPKSFLLGIDLSE